MLCRRAMVKSTAEAGSIPNLCCVHSLLSLREEVTIFNPQLALHTVCHMCCRAMVKSATEAGSLPTFHYMDETAPASPA
jgi:hypothetical protein